MNEMEMIARLKTKRSNFTCGCLDKLELSTSDYDCVFVVLLDDSSVLLKRTVHQTEATDVKVQNKVL